MAGDDLILEIDIQGALQVKEKFEEGVLFFWCRRAWRNCTDAWCSGAERLQSL